MFNRFVSEARQTAARAQRIARGLASPTIEAEHLLLALAEHPGDRASAVLSGAGLGRPELRAALDAEHERSLAAVGVSCADFELSATADPAKRPQWATSAKLALERALEAAAARGNRRIEPGHILVGVLRARAGTVPRALESAGIDPRDLERRMQASLDRTG